MLSITLPRPADNGPRLCISNITVCICALLLGALLAGCGGDAAPPTTRKPLTPQTPQSVSPPAGRDECHVTLDLAAVTSFESIASRLQRRREVTTADFAALYALPAYATLSEASGGRLLNERILENVMRHLFDAAPTRGGAARRPAPKRHDLLESFRYTGDHLAEVAPFWTRFTTAQSGCRALERVAGYLPAGGVPDTLRIVVLVAGPDVRFHHGLLLVDAGLALAAGEQLLPRLMAAALYRALATSGGPLPHEAGTGKSALLATFGKLRREAVAAWLEGYPTVSFDTRHPLLGQADPARQQAWTRGARALASLGELMGPLLRDRAALDERGTVIDDLLRGNQTYGSCGWVMAATIAARMGEARLQQSAASDAAFLAAYQEAALAAAQPGDTGHAADSPAPPPPPLSAEVYTQLMELLRTADR